MSTQPTEDEMARGMRALKVRLRNIALHDVDELRLREVTILEKNGLFSRDDIQTPGDHEIGVLSDPHHPDRVDISHGPLLIHTRGENKTNRFVIEVSYLILHPEQHVRAAALGYFAHLASEGNHLTPRAVKLLAESSATIGESGEQEWRSAAIALYDAIEDDFLCNLSGARQCVEARFEQGLGTYLPRVLNPSLAAIDSISLAIPSPSADADGLGALVSTMVNDASSLPNLCNRYYETLGHLPLGPSHSFAAAIDLWVERNGSEDLWTEMWNWANSIMSPVPRYHVTSYFVLHPDQVPDTHMTMLWDEIFCVINSGTSDSAAQEWHEPWLVRTELARLYGLHLEARLPDQDGERVAVFAWWLSERVATLLGPPPPTIKSFLKDAVTRECEVANYVWQAASVNMQPSSLRYATLSSVGLWSLSLQAQLGEILSVTGQGVLEDDRRKALSGAILTTLIRGFPPISVTSPQVFAFEIPVVQTATSVAGLLGEDDQEMLNTWTKIRTDTSIDDLLSVMKDIAAKTEPNQVLVANDLRVLAYLGAVPDEPLWECLDSEDWRVAVFHSLPDKALTLILEALSIVQTYRHGRWHADFPHLMAIVCDSCEDAKRRRLLFSFTMQAALAADSVEPILRILGGARRQEYAKDVEFWFHQLDAIQDYAPGWVAGRCRAFRTALNS